MAQNVLIDPFKMIVGAKFDSRNRYVHKSPVSSDMKFPNSPTFVAQFNSLRYAFDGQSYGIVQQGQIDTNYFAQITYLKDNASTYHSPPGFFATADRIFISRSDDNLITFDTDHRMPHIAQIYSGSHVTPNEAVSFVEGDVDVVHRQLLLSFNELSVDGPDEILFSHIQIGGGEADTGGYTMSMVGGTILAHIIRQNSQYAGCVLLNLVEDTQNQKIFLDTQITFKRPISSFPSYESDQNGFPVTVYTGFALNLNYTVFRGKYT